MLKNVYVRGVGGQKWAKFCLRSFWMTPNKGFVIMLTVLQRSKQGSGHKDNYQRHPQFRFFFAIKNLLVQDLHESRT